MITVEDSDHHDAKAFLVAAAAVVVENDDATVKRRECRTCQNVCHFCNIGQDLHQQHSSAQK